MLILIGSQAAKYHGIHLERKTNDKEYDVIGTKENLDHFLKMNPNHKFSESKHWPGKFIIHLTDSDHLIEFDATGNKSNVILQELLQKLTWCSRKSNLFNCEFMIPYVDILYSIKRTHANFNVNFEKNIHDLLVYQKLFGFKKANTAWTIWDTEAWDFMENFIRARKEESRERFGKIQERIKLNKSNNDFFKGGAHLRTYVHDDLHKAVAFTPGFPMYLRCKWDFDSAKIEEELFNYLHPKMKIYMPMEEAMVIALERYYIPFKNRDNFVPDLEKIYRRGLMKQTKDLCKGWFQDFILDNFLELQIPQWDFIDKFEKALERGEIRNVK